MELENKTRILKKIFLCGFFLYLFLSVVVFQIIGKINSLKSSPHEFSRSCALEVPDTFIVKLIFVGIAFFLVSLLALVVARRLEKQNALWLKRLILSLVFGNIGLTIWAQYVFHNLGSFRVSKFMASLVVVAGFLFVLPPVVIVLSLQVAIAIIMTRFLIQDSN